MMTTTTPFLTSWRARLAGGVLALLGLASVGGAQARDVYWSVGVHSPGVSVGLAHAPPVRAVSGPVYYAPPPPVYYALRPDYRAAPVIVVPAQRGSYGKHRHRHHDKHRGHRHGRGHGHGHR